MKYPLETTEKFITLRAKGQSYGIIAEQLGISKATAWDWAARFSTEIAKFRAIELEALRERLLAGYEEELTYLASELKRVQTELRGRDYGDVDTNQLFWYQGSLMSRIDKKFPPITMPEPGPDTPLEPETERNRTQPNDFSGGANSGEPHFSHQLSTNLSPQPADEVHDPVGKANGRATCPHGAAPCEAEPAPVPQDTIERNRTEPNEIPQPSDCTNQNSQNACDLPKKHKPYWLNGVYYSNPELPYEIARATFGSSHTGK